jgi:single-stranded-DNA-specific exonuclease
MLRASSKMPDPDPRERALARTLGLPDLVARVLLARGVADPDAVRAFLRPDLGLLHDPFRFRDMQKAVDRIRKALRTGEGILIHGDYDVDGISGTVLLHKFFGLLQARSRPYIPARSDGYSISATSVQAVLASGCTLVISVDNGTNAVESIAALQAAGCDVIVTDHHGTQEHVAAAFAMLNPRLPDAGYPDRDLAGVGVAFRLAAAVAASFTSGMLTSPEFAEFLADAMAYVALGTIADVAPLVGENRAMVFHGLRSLAQSRNPGVLALLDSAGLSHRSPDVEDIAFRLAPLLNAAGRMGHARQAVELLCAPGYAEAQAAAKVLEKHNEERRKVERLMLDEAKAQAAGCDDAAIVLGSDSWHRGVLGIVAARIAEQTGKPTILLGFADGIARGSGRCTSGLDLRSALALCGDLLLAHGGHAAAAGLELRRDDVDAFRTRFHRACEQLAATGQVDQIDGHAQFAELDPHTVKKLDMLGPFGRGHRRPRFCTADVRTIGNPTTDVRGLDLRLRVVSAGQILPVRIARAAPRFEEVRQRQGPWTLVYTPRINARGEEGPVYLDVHELHAEAGATAG